VRSTVSHDSSSQSAQSAEPPFEWDYRIPCIFGYKVSPIIPELDLWVNHQENCDAVERFTWHFTVSWYRLHPEARQALRQFWSGRRPEREFFGRTGPDPSDHEPGAWRVLLDGPRIDLWPSPHGPWGHEGICPAGGCQGKGHYLSFDTEIIETYSDYSLQTLIGYVLIQSYLRSTGKHTVEAWANWDYCHAGNSCLWIDDRERAERAIAHDRDGKGISFAITQAVNKLLVECDFNNLWTIWRLRAPTDPEVPYIPQR
jgi:hypothetical protein